MYRVLVCTPSENLSDTCLFLTRSGFTVTRTTTAEDALRSLARDPTFHAVFTELPALVSQVRQSPLVGFPVVYRGAEPGTVMANASLPPAADLAVVVQALTKAILKHESHPSSGAGGGPSLRRT